MKSILLLMFATGVAHATDLDDLQSEYRRACGGKIYSKCDDTQRSQEKLFDAAVDLGLESKRQVLMIFGADWCPPCVAIDRFLKNNPVIKARLERRYVILDLNAETESARKLERDLGVTRIGIPTFVIYDPGSKAARLAPSGIPHGVLIGLLASGSVNMSGSEPDRLGLVRMSILKEPLRHEGRWGTSRIEISTRLRGEARARLWAEVRRGFDLLHGFDYVNAARAAFGALELEGDNPVALTLLGIAASELEGGQPNYALKRFQEAWYSAETFPLDASDRAFVGAMFGYVCAMRSDGCGNPRLASVSRHKVLARALKRGEMIKPEYAAFIAFTVWDTARLERLAEAHPEFSAPHHYLTHAFESQGKVEQAAERARRYAELAPDLPHAQHMYGHILPQQGRWQAAIAQFELAHRLHLDQFAREGIEPQEDWHYAHNLDLLTAALVHRGRVTDAIALLPDRDLPGRPALALRKVSLQMVAGDYQSVLNATRAEEAEQGVTAGSRARRIEALLGLHRFTEAEAEMQRARAAEQLDEPVMIGARLAFASVRGDLLGTREPWAYRLLARLSLAPADSQAVLLNQLARMLRANGFDNWSTAAIERAALVRVLKDCGRVELADEIEALPTQSADVICPEDSICHPKR